MHHIDSVEVMKRMLSQVNHEWVAGEVGVRRQTVYRWSRGEYVRPERVEAVADAIRSLLPEYQKDAPPAWAARLLAGTLAVERKLGVTEEELEAARLQAAADAAVEAELGPPQPEADGVAGVGSA